MQHTLTSSYSICYECGHSNSSHRLTPLNTVMCVECADREIARMTVADVMQSDDFSPK